VRPAGIDLAEARRAIREHRKLRITYADAAGARTHRTVWPVALLFYVDVTLLGAWCELRTDFRHFRVERVLASTVLEDTFSTDGGRLLQRWHAQQAGAVVAMA
jgi:predicted DNA-binding transcriptional regulator YafY